jgi:hypothetical protein
MKPPPEFVGTSPLVSALNSIGDWAWRTLRILPGPGINHTGDGVSVFPGSGGGSTGAYPFQPIAVPAISGDPPADPFAFAVDRGHVVNIDGVPFSPSNIRAPIILPPETDDIPVYLDLTLDPSNGEILSGTIEFSDTGTIPTSPNGDSGTGLGPAKAYKQLFLISTTASGVSIGTASEHSRTNFALLRYVKEAVYDNSTWAMAFIAA